MTVDIKKSVRLRRVQLTIGEKFTHYFIVFYAFLPLVIGLYFLVTPENEMEALNSYHLILWPALLTILFYFIQYRRLRLNVYRTSLSREQVIDAIKYVTPLRNWREVKNLNADNIYVAFSTGRFRMQSWGERIAIIYDSNTIYFSSICDPGKDSSVTSFCRNYQHKKQFFKAVRFFESQNH